MKMLGRFALVALFLLSSVETVAKSQGLPTGELTLRIFNSFAVSASTMKQLVRALPLKDVQSRRFLLGYLEKHNLENFAKPEFSFKNNIIQVRSQGYKVSAEFDYQKMSFIILNGQKVFLGKKFNIESAFRKIQNELKRQRGETAGILDYLSVAPPAHAVIGTAVVAAATVVGVVLVGGVLNEVLIKPGFCKGSADPKICWRSNEIIIKKILDGHGAGTPLVLTQFSCESKQLTAASFTGGLRSSEVKMGLELSYVGNKIKRIKRRPNGKVDCQWEFYPSGRVKAVKKLASATYCPKAAKNLDDVLKNQFDIDEYPFDLLMKCCRSQSCRKSINQEVGKTRPPQAAEENEEQDSTQ